MRLRRIRLRNWRGVADREVVFAERGVTVVVGPNETGKTSFVEALDFLIEELDSAKSRRVLAAKPVHRDEGAEAEAEIDCGATTLVLRKRWHKRPVTELTVRGATAESLSGREAHERATALLAESADLALWRALRMAQGAAPGAPDLTSQTWLSQALDRTAGGAVTTDADTDLFAAAQAEHDRFWGATGPRKELVDLRTRRDALAADCARIREEIAAVERDVERAASLEREIAELGPKAADASTRLAKLAEDRARIDGLEAAARAAQAKSDLARQRVAAADAAVAARRAASDECASRRAAVAAAEEEAARIASSSSDTAARLAAAERAAEEASAELAAARDAATSAERDFDIVRAALDRDQIRERLDRIVAAEREAEAAAAVVASVRADDARLAALRKAHEDVVRATVRLESAAASVTVSASQAATVRGDGADRAVPPGGTATVRVAGRAVVDVPGAVRVEIVAGAGAAAPREAHEAAVRAFEAACGACGTTSLEDAVRANARLAEARRAVEARDRIVKENVRDLSREELEAKFASVTAKHERRMAERPAGHALPESFDIAQKLYDGARSRVAGAEQAAKSGGAALDAARKAQEGARTDDARRSGRLEELRAAAERAEAALAKDRAAVGDDGLAARASEAAAAADDAARVHRESAAALASAEPEKAAALLASAQQEAAALRRRQEEARVEAGTISGRLSARGEAGLAESLAAKDAELAAAESLLASRTAQAAAAKRLFEVLSAERDAARARYVAPYRDRVEALGRIVFGPTFRVTVADDLSIESRTIADVTVPFASLSGGAREQLGVIARLAAAQIVAGEGGVPVVLDDALGWSDETRLREMSALLGQASKDVQVIVLTCLRDRYQAVPGATFVTFA